MITFNSKRLEKSRSGRRLPDGSRQHPQYEGDLETNRKNLEKDKFKLFHSKINIFF